MDSKELVFKTMVTAAKPLRNSEIAELTGLSKSIVEKVMKELKSEDKIFSPQRCFWQSK